MASSQSSAEQSATIPVFVPLSEQSRTGEVVQQLAESIRMGLLPAGTRFPPEAELAEQLGVSTMTLREALATLREQGLVVTRRGRGGGSFVQPPSGHLGGGSQEREETLRARSVDDLRDLLDHHAAIDVATAKLAAARAGQSEVSRLTTDVTRLASARSSAERRRADAGFHINLAVSAHSARLTREEVRFQGELSGILWLLPRRNPNAKRMAAQHQEIVDAIVKRDPDAARSAAEAHAGAVSEMLIAWRLALRS